MSLAERRRPRVVHPWLFAIYPALFQLAANRDQLFLADLVTPVAVSLAAVGALLLGLCTVLDRHRAGWIATTAWIALFSYGHVVALVFAHRPWPAAWGVQRFVLAAYAAGIALVAWLAVRARRPPTRVTVLLNGVGTVLVAINLVALAAWQLDHRAGAARPSAHAAAGQTRSVAGSRPDIYYLVLDAYGRDDVLRQRFGLTGLSLADRLEARGFFVASASFANYASTFLSLAASLNMAYVDDMPPDETAWHMFNQRIADNAVLRFLDARGYRSVHFRSGKGITNDNPKADLRYRGGRLDELSTLLLEKSLLAPALRRFIDADRRATILYALEHLPSIAGMPQATFTFAHILCPHPPFLFRADGTPQEQPIDDPDRAYLEQVAFISDRVLAVVDQWLAAEPPPIIVIQGDHGPSSAVGWNTASPEWRPSPELVAERMPILNAIHLPGRDAATVFDAGISPVNTFRLIFAATFDADLERLPDRAFFSTYALPYRLVEVTDALRPAGTEPAAEIAGGVGP